MVAYQIGSLLQPFAGETEQEIRDQLEPFRPSEAQARRGRSVEEQLIDWEQDYPLVTRRPNLATLQPECPTVLRALIAECWGDDPLDRPLFHELIPAIEDVLCALSPERAEAVTANAERDDSLLAAVQALQIQGIKQHNEDIVYGAYSCVIWF
jgi:hypothetical protein